VWVGTLKRTPRKEHIFFARGGDFFKARGALKAPWKRGKAWGGGRRRRERPTFFSRDTRAFLESR